VSLLLLFNAILPLVRVAFIFEIPFQLVIGFLSPLTVKLLIHLSAEFILLLELLFSMSVEFIARTDHFLQKVGDYLQPWVAEYLS
jgi:hypothetical protein